MIFYILWQFFDYFYIIWFTLLIKGDQAELTNFMIKVILNILQ